MQTTNEEVGVDIYCIYMIYPETRMHVVLYHVLLASFIMCFLFFELGKGHENKQNGVSCFWFLLCLFVVVAKASGFVVICCFPFFRLEGTKT